MRRLPKWKRPDLEGTDPERWPGRWSLARTAGTLGPQHDEATMASAIARQWLERYGIVSREYWKRERPSIPWRPIYLELRSLEMRGDVRRGYFVDGLAGVQFAKPEAVDMLRGATEGELPVVIISMSDPANVHNLPLPAGEARQLREERAEVARGSQRSVGGWCWWPSRGGGRCAFGPEFPRPMLRVPRER